MKVIFDLKKGDYNESQVEVLNQDIVTKDKIILAKTQENQKNVEKVLSLESQVRDCMTIDVVNTKTIENLNKQIKSEKKKVKAWKIIAVVLLVGLAVK